MYMSRLLGVVGTLILAVTGLSQLAVGAADASGSADDGWIAASPSLTGSLPGIAEPIQLAKLSVSVDGPLRRMEVQEGDRVAAGQLLAAVDSRVAVHALEAANLAASQRGALVAAESELRAATRYLDRILHAEQLRAASELEIDQARERLAQAEAGVLRANELAATAQAQRELEQARLDSHQLAAPFDGRILEIEATVGQVVTRSTPIITPKSRVETWSIAPEARLTSHVVPPKLPATYVHVSESSPSLAIR